MSIQSINQQLRSFYQITFNQTEPTMLLMKTLLEQKSIEQKFKYFEKSNSFINKSLYKSLNQNSIDTMSLD
jgi:hypothetical protein